MRICFLIHRWLSSGCVLTWWKGRGSALSPFLSRGFFSIYSFTGCLRCCARAFSSCSGRRQLRCGGFSLQRFLLLWTIGCMCVGFSSCNSLAELPRGKWDLPRPGIETVSPVLAGGLHQILNHWTTRRVPDDSFLITTLVHEGATS